MVNVREAGLESDKDSANKEIHAQIERFKDCGKQLSGLSHAAENVERPTNTYPVQRRSHQSANMFHFQPRGDLAANLWTFVQE